MIYEYRKYIATPGNLHNLHERFEQAVLGLFKRYEIDVVAFWTPISGASIMNELHYIVRWADVAAMTQTWAAFMADPEVIEVVGKWDKNGPIVADAQSHIWGLTEYSPAP